MKRKASPILTSAVVMLLAITWLPLRRTTAEHAAPRNVIDGVNNTLGVSSYYPTMLAPLPLVVNSTGDAMDATIGDGLCETSTPGECTLRAAIQEANAVNDADTINFTIPTATDANCVVGTGVCTISPASALPVITQPVTIDGYTQPGSIENTSTTGDNADINIELNGTGAGAGVDGLNITAGSCTVRGLSIYRFGGDGIELATNGSNTVRGNFIGLNATGTAAGPGNTGNGVNINNVGTNTIGGTTPQARNLISANTSNGVNITGASATGNTVASNYIGTDRTGTVDLGNVVNGVLITTGAPTNTIGGSTATPGTAPGNVISGNDSDGIEIANAASSTNTVQGNLIGLQAGGVALLRNTGNGVFINGAASNTIGGSTATARNVITGGTAATSDGVDIQDNASDNNVVAGNYIGTDINGTADFGSGGDGVRLSGTGPDNNTIGGSATTPGTAPGNVISGNNGDGVEFTASGTTGNLVQGNLIGLQANGTTALANGANGVLITTSATSNTVGGSTPTPGTGLGNVISGNGADGVEIGLNADTNTVRGNLIGLQAGGTATLGNVANGVHLTGTINSTVGGATSDLRNVISANTTNGVLLNEGQNAVGDANTVAGNYIGTDITGAVDLGNTGDGVRIDGGDGDTIGGIAATTGAAPGNVISGNNSDGIELVDSGADTNSNLIRGNFIGTKSNGTEALPNIADGVGIRTSVTTTTVGGTAAGTRNVISGNGSDGVEFASGGHTIQGNYIGTQSDGTTALGNTGHGVFDSAATTTATAIGGTAAGAGNTIAFNGGDGVFILSGINVNISRNSIHSNTGLGIDLGTDGVTPNDMDDPDTGANNLQNFPVITNAQQGSSTTITGTLNSTPSTTFTIEFFSNTTPDPSGNGEGQTYLDSISVTTDAGGDVAFSHTIATTVPLNQEITATATDPAGNTSEFSNSQIVLSPTLVKLRSFNATTDNGEVMLRWESGYEVDNLGYNIYREQNGKRTRVTPSIIAGSALLAGERTVLTAGQSYTWFDRMPAGGGSISYWLEDVDVNGKRTLHGPYIPVKGRVDRHPSAQEAPAALLNQLSAETKSEQQEESADSDEQPAQPDKAATVSAATVTSQQSVAGQQGVKIMARRSGWVRVTQPELVAAGLGQSVNPAHLQLFVSGRQMPIKVSANASQGQFTASDWIEFYARGLDAPTTDTRTYYLLTGTKAGLRISRSPYGVTPDETQTGPNNFNYTVERRERSIYFSGLDNGDAENFFGQIITTTPITSPLSVRHLDPTATTRARLRVTLQGVTAGRHLVEVQVNGVKVGRLFFNGRAHPTATFKINPSLLHEGENSVRMVALSGEMDISLVDTLLLTYARTYTADNDRSQFKVSTTAPVSIDGFGSSNIRIMDITNPNVAQEVVSTVQARNGSYTAKVQISNAGPRNVRTLLAFVDNQVDHPASINRNEPSNLASSANGADFLIITHRSFRDSVQPLADLRRSQGLQVSVVDVEDVYDEFSYGVRSPQAIRAFITRAVQKWQRAPRYVLLVGDATYDPRDYLGRGEGDLVPTKMLYALTMETASDDWLADFNGDGVPELAVGRLPVRTSQEAATIIGRIINFSPDSAGQGALLVADRNDHENNFEAASQSVQSLLPSGVPARVINRGNNDTGTVRGQIIDSINQGPLVVNYFGHGSVGLWTGSGLLNTSDAAALTNGTRLPLFTMMTCLNGFFHDVIGESMSEALLKAPEGGAIAVWASSGLTAMNGQAEMDEQLYEKIFGTQAVSLGDAIRAAKAATQDQAVRRTWIFFGDPTMRLR